MRSSLKKILIPTVLIFVILTSFTNLASSQVNNLNRIKLSWDAYTKEQKNQQQYISYISHKTMYKYRATQKGSQFNLDFTVGVTIDTSQSILNITRLKKLNTQEQLALLNHEQGHSDLAVIYGRELYKQLSKKTYSVTNYQKETRDIYLSVMEKLSDINYTYDSETENGDHSEKQKEWDAYFKKRLTETLL